MRSGTVAEVEEQCGGHERWLPALARIAGAAVRAPPWSAIGNRSSYIMTTLMACSNAIAPREQQVGAAVLGARGCRRRGREWGTKRDLTGKFLSKTTEELAG